MNNEQAKAAALSWHGEAGGELLPQLTANELAGIVNEAIQQAAVPEGWKLVPVELSDTMQSLLTASEGDTIVDGPMFIKQLWSELLAASPAPPKKQPALVGGEGGGVPLSVGARLFSFSDFDDWCDTAKKKFKKARTSSGRVVCVDQKGRICAWGEHFMTARDEEAFPVDAFLLRQDMDAEAPTGQINPDSAGQGVEGGE